MTSLRTAVAIGVVSGLLVAACASVAPPPAPPPPVRATPRIPPPPEDVSERTAPEACIRRAPPEPPRVDWIAAGCPSSFGGCLSGPDAAEVSAYLRATRRWMDETYRRCDGR